jgi:DNA-binding MarR family transcriptional regulator
MALHLSDWMVVTGPGNETEKCDDDSQSLCDNALSERQRRILKAIGRGAELRQKNVIGMFRGEFSPSTVKTDIKALRSMGLITTHQDAYYVPSEGT